MMANKDHKLSKGIIVIIVLLIVLCFTSAALAFSLARVENNLFRFGEIIIDIGYYDDHGNPKYNEDGPMFVEEQGDNNTMEKGEEKVKNIFVVNKGFLPMYYRLYFEGVSGRLKDIISVRIEDKDGNTLIGFDKASDFTKENSVSIGELLNGRPNSDTDVGDLANLKLVLTYPENASALNADDSVSYGLKFNLIAEGVQVRNNDEREFD